MRRAHSATSHIARRAGVPCGTHPSEPRYEPGFAYVQPEDPFLRCMRDVAFGIRCPNVGTHRIRRELLDRTPWGALEYPQQQWWRFCDTHARAYFHEPIPEGEQ